MFGLLGPNGSGKSTLLRILSTLLRPEGGAARIVGHDVVSEPDAVRRALGVVFQQASVDRKLTVEENLSCHASLYGMSGPALAVKLQATLERLGIAARRGERVERLSGGLERRVELAKALLIGARVLLLDEPSTALDPGARRDFLGYLRELRDAAGLTVLLSTHDLEEAERCDRVAIFDPARIEDGDAVAALGLLEIVRAEQHRQPRRVAQLAQVAEEVAPRPRIERGARLVQEEHAGADEERLRQLDAPLEAAGQLLHPLGAPAGDPEPLERRVEPLRERAPGHPVEAPVAGEVLLDRELPVDARVLEDDAERAPHDVRLAHHVVAHDARRAPLRPEQCGEDAEERALPAAVRAEEPEHLARIHREGDAGEREALSVAVAQVLDGDGRAVQVGRFRRARRVSARDTRKSIASHRLRA